MKHLYNIFLTLLLGMVVSVTFSQEKSIIDQLDEVAIVD